ncbi:MAG: DinB/UmuC family translesion DNA polymerase [Acidiferrobacterales bacterium]
MFGNESADIAHVRSDRMLLDVTHWQRDEGAPESIAQRILSELETRLPDRAWRVGVAGDRWAAGLAAAMAPTGSVNVIPPWEMRDRLHAVSLDLLPGCNRGMRLFLSLLNVHTCGELAELPATMLARHYGAAGRRLWLLCRGRDPGIVIRETLPATSIDQMRVLPPRTVAPRTVVRYLRHMCQRLAARLRRLELQPGQLHVKLQYALPCGAKDCAPDVVRQFSLPDLCVDDARFFAHAQDVLVSSWRGQPLASACLRVTELRNLSGQLELFSPPCTALPV